MSFHATTLKLRCLIPFLLGIAPISAFSQAANSPIAFANTDAVTVTLVDPPVSVGGSGGSGPGGDSGGGKQWLKVEFHYSVTPPEDKGDYLDAVQFKVWIEGRDMLSPDAPGKDGLAIGLTGSVTYINLYRSRDAYGVFYVHPSTLGRYSTKSGVSDFTRKFNVHVQALVGGNDMDDINKNKENDPHWFETLKAIPNLVYRQNQSPFLTVDVSRYPAIKLPESAGQ